MRRLKVNANIRKSGSVTQRHWIALRDYRESTANGHSSEQDKKKRQHQRLGKKNINVAVMKMLSSASGKSIFQPKFIN